MMKSRSLLAIMIAALSGCAVYEDGPVVSPGVRYDVYPDYYPHGYAIYGDPYRHHRPHRSYQSHPPHSHPPARTAPASPGIIMGAPDHRGVQSAPPRPGRVQRGR